MFNAPKNNVRVCARLFCIPPLTLGSHTRVVFRPLMPLMACRVAWQACPAFKDDEIGAFAGQDGVEEPDVMVAEPDIFGSVGTVDAAELARDEARSVSATCTSLDSFTRCRFVSETL